MKNFKITRKLNEENAITLVALTVTIIILLILSGIAISTLTNKGIFRKANEAKQKSKDAQELENTTLINYGNSINEIISTGHREENINNNEYSLEEKAIGTWIDGKTLYRKVIREEITESGSKEYYLRQSIPKAESYIIESALAFEDSSYTGACMEVSSSNTSTSQYDISFTSFDLSRGRLWLVRGINSPKFLQLIVKYTKKAD